MEKKITGFVTGVGKSNRIAIDQTWYSLTIKATPYLNNYSVGDKVHASLTGREIDNKGSPIGEISFLTKASDSDSPTETAKGEKIATKPLGNQKPVSDGSSAEEQRMRSMALSYAKDIDVAWITKMDKPSNSHTESIILIAEEFYQYIRTGRFLDLTERR